LVLLLALISRLPWPAGVLAGRDAIAAAVVAISLNLTAFVLGPVTVDRSVSVFMLSRLADAQASLTAEDLRGAFVARYVLEWDQIGRRLNEQISSGNVDQTSAGSYRLTPQGRSFMHTARIMSRLFGGDPRFVGIGQPEH
jgi:ActR/RegA family two-component response regulator